MKIQCPCGQKFSFDPSEETAASSFRFECPSCGQDHSTAIQQLASSHLQEAQSRSSATSPPPASLLQVSEEAAGSLGGSEPAKSRLGLAGVQRKPPPDSSSGQNIDEPAATPCARHPRQTVEHHCLVCGKAMCPQCMKAHGYVCSVYCRDAAQRTGVKVPLYEGQAASLRAQAHRRTRRIAAGVLAGVALLLGAWMWYGLVGSKPKVAGTFAFDDSTRQGQCRMADDRHVLVWRKNRLSCHALPGLEPLWEKNFSTGAEEAMEDEHYYFEEPGALDWHVHDEFVWLALADRLVQLRWADGSIVKEVLLPGGKRLFVPGGERLHAVASGDLGKPTALRVDAGSGDATSTITFLESEENAVAHAGNAFFGFSARPPEVSTRLVGGDSELIRMTTRLLEYRIEKVETMKAPPKQAALNGNVSASDSLEVANEILNELERNATGGMEERDASRYEVELEWLFHPNSKKWKTEVTGTPFLFNLPSLDLLIAGQEVRAVDRSGSIKWAGTLAHPLNRNLEDELASPMDRDRRTAVPCLEHDGLVLVFDLGMINAFEIDSGAVRWRLPVAGTSSVIRDEAGFLYVNATDATQDQVKYSQQIELERKIDECLFKVDPVAGKILWQNISRSRMGSAQGPRVYSLEWDDGRSGLGWTDSSRSGSRLYCLDSGSGMEQWEFDVNEPPLSIDIRGRRIAILQKNQLQLVTFMAF